MYKGIYIFILSFLLLQGREIPRESLHIATQERPMAILTMTPNLISLNFHPTAFTVNGPAGFTFAISGFTGLVHYEWTIIEVPTSSNNQTITLGSPFSPNSSFGGFGDL